MRNEEDIERVRNLLANERAQLDRLKLERQKRQEAERNNPHALKAIDTAIGQVYRTKNNTLLRVESKSPSTVTVWIYETKSNADISGEQTLFSDGVDALKAMYLKVPVEGDYTVTKDGEIITSTPQEKNMRRKKNAEAPATAETQAAEATAAAPKKRGKAKRPETALIDDAIVAGKSNEEILAALEAQFPQTDKAWLKKTLSARRWFAKKAKA